MPFEYIKPETRVSKISSTLTNMKMAWEKLCLSITLIIGFLSATTLAVERNERLCKFLNFSYVFKTPNISLKVLNMPNLVERGLASNPKMEYQVFLCIFQRNSAMATYGLKEMGKFLWEGREKGV